jgi:hypothetical protein
MIKLLGKMKELHMQRQHLCKGAQQGPTHKKTQCIIDRRKAQTHDYREAV